MFELETAIANWRAALVRAGFSSGRRIEELESHLLEEYEAQITAGASPAQAFERAVELLGNARELHREFRRASLRRRIPSWVYKIAAALAAYWVAALCLSRALGLPILGMALWLAELAFWGFFIIWGSKAWLNRRKYAYFDTAFWLSADSRRAVELARIEGGRRAHHYVGTEHLLLGILGTQDDVLQRALARCAITPEEIRAEINAAAGEASGQHDGSTWPATPRLRRALQIAAVEAKNFGNGTVAPVHILAGLLREGDGLAAHVLQKLGATHESIRLEIEKSS